MTERKLGVFNFERFNTLLRTQARILDWKPTIDGDNITKYHVVYEE